VKAGRTSQFPQRVTKMSGSTGRPFLRRSTALKRLQSAACEVIHEEGGSFIHEKVTNRRLESRCLLHKRHVRIIGNLSDRGGTRSVRDAPNVGQEHLFGILGHRISGLSRPTERKRQIIPGPIQGHFNTIVRGMYFFLGSARFPCPELEHSSH
jgi:hypothetical protein